VLLGMEVMLLLCIRSVFSSLLQAEFAGNVQLRFGLNPVYSPFT